ncbi:hypothetical protein [uncultured Sphingobacterium sp.]|uniref:hypothetical protein n=1 Tax=uncultured Sphingobacterium sp. TaxID=182688 RepID=UPI0025D2BE39|nr:hypothetical protein [uncultured Sphingobacterium sp.]
MKRNKSTLDVLSSELNLLREIELHHILGGTGGGGGSFNDIWNKLANGDLTDIPRQG